jgi:hypothetical protein
LTQSRPMVLSSNLPNRRVTCRIKKKEAMILLNSPYTWLHPRPSQPSGNRINLLRPPTTCSTTFKKRPILLPPLRTLSTFEASQVDFTNSLILEFRSASSTVATSHAMHRGPKKMTPFFFPQTGALAKLDHLQEEPHIDADRKAGN